MIPVGALLPAVLLLVLGLLRAIPPVLPGEGTFGAVSLLALGCVAVMAVGTTLLVRGTGVVLTL